MSIICDHCKTEIIHENSDDEYLRLEAQARTGGGCVTDMALTSELDGPVFFCGMRCLCQWAAIQRSPYTGKPYGVI